MLIFNGNKISNDYRINSQNAIDDSFDLNTNWYGIKHINGKAPQNYPKGFLPWGVCFAVETVRGGVTQIAIDTNNSLAIRSYSGAYGAQSWSEWKIIGGVNRLTICYTFIPEMEVAA